MLLDSSGLMCLLDKRERRHTDAVSSYRTSGRHLIHNYVLAEFIALTIARRVPKARALEFISTLLDSVEVVWVDESLHQAGVDLLQARLDKEWSLCDAVSFIVMRRWNETGALTTDHHFEQAGFVRLLQS